MSTPIFDRTQAEHDVPMLPIPAHPTHEEFLAEHGYPEWLAGVMSGTVQYERPTKHKADPTGDVPLPSMTGTMRPVPTKRNKR
jgi:hypothetical protein